MHATDNNKNKIIWIPGIFEIIFGLIVAKNINVVIVGPLKLLGAID